MILKLPPHGSVFCSIWFWFLCYDRRSAGQSVLEYSTHLGLTTRSLLLVWQLRSCSCGAPSLTRGPVYLLYVLLALASSVFLGSESIGTWDHILLSQIWDFPFRRLLRLAGSRWRYSTPPRHGSQLSLYSRSTDRIGNTIPLWMTQTAQKTRQGIYISPVHWRADCCCQRTINIRHIVECAYARRCL
jgi:hypothetical protein